ncbi:M50 family metallopeptidase [uncultured Jatrophihabitans sp.]|uniref:M50 family metallopeptidase n=1 Tax=uncultured Jatrophihabitans sp. TaxID=1610747 RepID=UPI0035CAF7DB
MIEQPRNRAERQPGAVPLGRVRGVPILIAPSWFITAVLVAVLYGSALRDALPRLHATGAYAAGAAFAVLFGACVLAHEIGHTLVARILQHEVRRIVLFVMGGVSEMDRDPDRPRDALLTAAAGPLVSLVIAGVAYLAEDAAPRDGVAWAMLALLCWSNLVLAAFNLLPGLPLDGGHLLRAALAGCGCAPLTATRIAVWAGRLLAIGIAVAELAVDRSSLGLASGLLCLGLAAYLWAGATQAWKIALLTSRLPAVTVTDLLRPGMFVPADLSVAEALRRAAERGARGLVVVDAADRPDAIVDEALIGAAPPERRPWTTVTQVARRLEPGLTLPTQQYENNKLEPIK